MIRPIIDHINSLPHGQPNAHYETERLALFGHYNRLDSAVLWFRCWPAVTELSVWVCRPPPDQTAQWGLQNDAAWRLLNGHLPARVARRICKK